MKDDGGAAFPYGGTELDHVEVNPDGSPRPIFRAVSGMSLRDWFAGQVLMGCFANDADYPSWSDIAERCYKASDAMLSERNKGEK